MELGKICFFVGIICGTIGFLMAKIYPIAIWVLVLGIGMGYQEYSNQKQIESIIKGHRG